MWLTQTSVAAFFRWRAFFRTSADRVCLSGLCRFKRWVVWSVSSWRTSSPTGTAKAAQEDVAGAQVDSEFSFLARHFVTNQRLACDRSVQGLYRDYRTERLWFVSLLLHCLQRLNPPTTTQASPT